MKKLTSILLAIIAIIALTLPAAAQIGIPPDYPIRAYQSPDGMGLLVGQLPADSAGQAELMYGMIDEEWISSSTGDSTVLEVVQMDPVQAVGAGADKGLMAAFVTSDMMPGVFVASVVDDDIFMVILFGPTLDDYVVELSVFVMSVNMIGVNAPPMDGFILTDSQG